MFVGAGGSSLARSGRAYSVGTGFEGSANQPNSYSRTPGVPKKRQPRFASITEQDPFSDPPTEAQAQNDEKLEADLLYRHGREGEGVSSFDDPGRQVWSTQTGGPVIMKRVLRSSTQTAQDTDREITVRSSASDPSILPLIESLELKSVMWTVIEYRPLHTTADLIRQHGPIPEDALKTSVNELFAGIAALFYAGFAHLRINDHTVCFDDNRHLVITDFKYCCEYTDEKVDDVYAITKEKYGSDLYTAPEVFACNSYNARKATIWSCGILLYFMVAGQTDKLSILDHPVFEKTPTNPETATTPSKHRRASSVANVQSRLITYPNSRFDVPNYIRWIVPKMLMSDPLRRAELIEVATRVPKDYSDKTARPLVELAWLDYKDHVGPLAGLDFDRDNDGSSSIFSFASSISNISNPFRTLLGKNRHSRRQSAPPVSSSNGSSGAGNRVMYR